MPLRVLATLLARRRAGTALVLASVAALGGLVAVRSAVAKPYEAPPFEVVETREAFELRRYASTLIAETLVDSADPERALSVGFQRLAAFIFGDNAPRTSIAMTVPVGLEASAPAGKGEAIAMTVPVGLETGGAAAQGGPPRWRITFMMPSKYTLETVPRPLDPTITLRATEPQLFAAVRFSGRARHRDFTTREQTLRAALAAAGLTAAGPATYAYYDPPWTLGPLRRNEVLVPVRVADAAR